MMQQVKFGTDELMELIDVFSVSAAGQARIRAILAEEAHEPDAGNFFRYYNPRSKTVAFEREFAAHSGAPHVLALNSGTSALIAALAAAGAGPGCEVIVPAYTFFATVSAVVAVRAIPVIVDIDETLTLDPAAFEAAITPRTKAVIPVHMLGLPAQMDKIMAIARRRNLTVIEDAAQACGGRFQGRFLGTWGDFGCVSLDAYKVIGSGEGGILMAADEWLFTRAQSYHDTAACWRPDRYGKERREGELFCGENYRMSEVQAAVALAQLRKLDWIVAALRRNSALLREKITLPPGVRWQEASDPEGVCGYMLPMLFDSEEHCARAQRTGAVGGNAGDATRGVRNWHMAWHWEHILGEKTVTADGCPFHCSLVKDRPRYTAASWPRTQDIIHRMGTIAVSQFDTESDLLNRAELITKELAKC